MESGTNDLTTDGKLQDLVISQVYGGGGNNGAAFTHDFVELFNQGDHEVELAGKGLQYAPATGAFSTTKNYLVLPASTPKLQPGHYFLIQLAVGGSNGQPPQGAALTDVDYVATQPLELLAMSSSAGKLALVDSNDLDLSNCDAGADAGACGDPKFIDLVGFGPNASQFRGAAPVPALSNATAAVRHTGGCAHSGDNSLDFQPLAPAPRNGKTVPSAICSTVDASAPPPVPVADAGPKPDASKPPKDAGPKKDAAAKDSGKHSSGDDDDDTTAGDDDDDDKKPARPDAGDGDDDDDDDTVPSGAKPKDKRPVSSTIGSKNGAAPPSFPATSPDCAMSSGPVGSFGGLGAVFGLALVGAALRRRRPR